MKMKKKKIGLRSEVKGARETTETVTARSL